MKNTAEKDVARFTAALAQLRSDHAAAQADAARSRADLQAAEDAYQDARLRPGPQAEAATKEADGRRVACLRAMPAVTVVVDRLAAEVADVSAQLHRAQVRADAARIADAADELGAQAAAAEAEHGRLAVEAAQVAAEQDQAVEDGDAAGVLACQVKLIRLRGEAGAARTRLLQVQIGEARARAAALVEQVHHAGVEADRAAAAVTAAVQRHDQAQTDVRDLAGEEQDWRRRIVDTERALARHTHEQRAAAVGAARNVTRSPLGAILAGAGS